MDTRATSGVGFGLQPIRVPAAFGRRPDLISDHIALDSECGPLCRAARILYARICSNVNPLYRRDTKLNPLEDMKNIGDTRKYS